MSFVLAESAGAYHPIQAKASAP